MTMPWASIVSFESYRILNVRSWPVACHNKSVQSNLSKGRIVVWSAAIAN